MTTCEEAIGELDQLLAQVRVPVLLPEDAERILERSDQLARVCPSEAAAERCARIRASVDGAAVRPAGGGGTRRPGGAPSPRLAALERALAGHAVMSVSVLRRALAEGGFHRGEALSAADALHFQAIVSGPLLQMGTLYRKAGDVPAERLRGAEVELEELAGFVPACIRDAEGAVAELRGFVAARAADAEARARLEALVPVLEELLGRDDPPAAGVQAAREALDGNAWAAGHPDDAGVRRAAALLDRLHDKRAVCDELRHLPQEVSQALSARPDQVGEAARRVEDAHGRARGHALGEGEPLRRAAGRVVEAAEERLRQVAELPPGVEELRRARAEAVALRDALWLLPASLAPEAAALVRTCDALVLDADGRVQALVLAEVEGELAGLAPEEVPAFAARLADGEYPEVRRHGERLALLYAAAKALPESGDVLDEAALDRLRADAGEVPPGPFREWLREAVSVCRDARAELDAVEAAMQGDAAVEPLHPRVDALAERFPAWTRVVRAREGLNDLALVRQVRECAARGGNGLGEALRLAAGLTAPARRERVAGALELLGDVGRALPRLRRVLAARGNGERRMGEVVAAARTLFAGLQAPHATACEEEFPGPWREVDAAARLALLDDVPAALRGWLEGAAAGAGTEELDRVEALFTGWARELGPAFPAFVESHGRQLLETRRVELRLGPLLAEGRFDEAREVVLRAASRLHPDEAARQRRRVDSADAVAAWRRDGTAALDTVVQAVLRHGADADLVDALLEAFATKGCTAALAAVASQGEGSLAAFPGVAQLARWCMLFERGLLAELVAELGAGGAARGTLDEFVGALSRSGRHGQATWVLHALRGQEGCTPAQAARLDEGLALLRRSLEESHRELAGRLNALEAGLDAAAAGPAPAGAPSLADVHAAADAAAAETDTALAQVTAWQEAVNETLRWLPQGLAPRRTAALLVRLRTVRGRLLASREMLAEIHDAVTGARTADLERWKELQRRFGLGGRSVGRLLEVERLVHAYVQDWQFVADLAHRLAELHRAGGVGMTSAKLESELRRMNTYHYDFHADRFRLLPLLGEDGWDGFVAVVRAQVAEVEQVAGWLRQSRAVMAGIVDPLRARMERWHRLDDARREHEAAAIRALLQARTGGNPSAAELHEALPRPSASPAAQEMLRAATADPWFSDLEAAVAVCRDRSPAERPRAG